MAKSQFPSTFNWQSTNPTASFLPITSTAGNSNPSGALSGTMSGTNTIYSNILGMRQTDVQGLEIAWTGTPSGNLQVMISISGINWTAINFIPAITQPTGTPDNIYINLSTIGMQYMYLQYTNSTGTGQLTAYSQCKAFNN